MKRKSDAMASDADPGTPCARVLWGKSEVQNSRSWGARELTDRLKIASLNFVAIVAPLSNPFFAPLRRSLTLAHRDSLRAAIRCAAAQASADHLHLDAKSRVSGTDVASVKTPALENSSEKR